MIESDSLVGSKWLNALKGTGCDMVALLLPLPPPPPPPELVPVELDRDVPDAEVVALEDMLPEVLAPVSEVVLVLVLAELDRAELEFTFAVAALELVFPDDSAEVALEAEETPFVAEELSSEVVAPPPPEPAPADDPCVLGAVVGTVPAVVACT